MLMPHENNPEAIADGALATLFERHHSRVLNAAYRVTGSRQDSEDVLQTVFLRLARKPPRTELSGSYLHRAAVNASIDLLRSRARARAIPLDEHGGDVAEPGAVSQEREQHDREFARRLRAALLEVPEKGARIFVLRYFEGLDNKDIAAMLALSQTAVAVSLHRTRKRLQKKLQDFTKGDPS